MAGELEVHPATEKGKAAAQLQQEALDVVDECVFDLALSPPGTILPPDVRAHARHRPACGAIQPKASPAAFSYPPYPSAFRLAAMAASSLAASACCSRKVAVSRFIFSSNGSLSSSCASAPT